MATDIRDIGLDFVPAPGRGVETVDVGGEAVLVDGEGTGLHLLNATAALVWSCLDGRAPVGVIVDDIAEGLALARDKVAADMLGLLHELWTAGLLAGSEGDAEAEAAGIVDPRFIPEPRGG